MQIKVDTFDFDNISLVDESGQLQEFNLKKELAVNEYNLMTEMLEQPSKFIYWAAILEKLKYFQESKELQLEQLIAQLDTAARDHYAGTTTKATKDVVEAYRKSQPEYAEMMASINYYNYIVGKVARIVKAFEQRKDMLQSYGKQVAEQKMFGQGAGGTIPKYQYPLQEGQ